MIPLRHRPCGATLREVLLIARIWAFVSLLAVLLRVCGVTRLLRLCGLRAPHRPEDAPSITACVEGVLARHGMAER